LARRTAATKVLLWEFWKVGPLVAHLVEPWDNSKVVHLVEKWVDWKVVQWDDSRVVWRVVRSEPPMAEKKELQSAGRWEQSLAVSWAGKKEQQKVDYSEGRKEQNLVGPLVEQKVSLTVLSMDGQKAEWPVVGWVVQLDNSKVVYSVSKSVDSKEYYWVVWWGKISVVSTVVQWASGKENSMASETVDHSEQKLVKRLVVARVVS
jgi:hypothetical protein